MKEFVEKLTEKKATIGHMFYATKLHELNDDVNIALLLTGAIGIASETGELNEIVKKCIFQGKPMDDETIFHCKRELGDIIWYWISTCRRALDLDPNEVIEENVKKLKARYPDGEFDVHYPRKPPGW